MRFHIRWDGNEWQVSRNGYDGGEVVDAADYDEIRDRLEIRTEQAELAESRAKEAVQKTVADLRAMKATLRRLAQAVVDNPRCGDPDCCDRAMANNEARESLRAYLERTSTDDE